MLRLLMSLFLFLVSANSLNGCPSSFFDASQSFLEYSLFQLHCVVKVHVDITVVEINAD